MYLKKPILTSALFLAADAEADALNSWCHRKGESCWKVKRAAEALADALAEPGAEASPGK